MAAGDFTASALDRAQIKLGDMFATPNISQTELLAGAALTARALLAKNKARTIERLEGNRCVGVKAWHMRTNARNGQSFAAPTTCAVPCGNEAETISTNYDNVVLAEADGKVLDNRCSNAVEFGDELAAVQAHMMSQLRYEFNRFVAIPTIAAASQPNLDTFMDPVWEGVNNAPRITVPLADFNYANFSEFQTVAENNNFGEFFFVSGRLLRSQEWFAMLNKGNEGFRDQALAFAQQEIYFDTRDLDQTMTRKTLFAIDQNSFAFWNNTRSTPTPTAQNTDNGRKWAWVQADPIMTYNRNGQTVPVLYEFEMQEVCVGRDTLGFQQNSYCLYGRLIGGLKFAPTGPNGEKGVLQFSDQ